MEQVFDGRESDFDENGIILGIIPKDISYEINKDQTSAAFVQAGELWLYESKKGNLTKVFSMPDQEGRGRQYLFTLQLQWQLILVCTTESLCSSV